MPFYIFYTHKNDSLYCLWINIFTVKNNQMHKKPTHKLHVNGCSWGRMGVKGVV